MEKEFWNPDLKSTWWRSGVSRRGHSVIPKVVKNPQLLPCRSRCFTSNKVRLYASNLKRGPTRTALYLRSVCWIITAFRGLRCHPLTCMLLKLR
jgi:hypothetical protein